MARRNEVEMARLHFDRAGVLELLAHAEAAPSRRKVFGQAGPVMPGLILVADEGVYLLSNGVPMLRNPDNRDANKVVYAREADPTKMAEGDCRAAKNLIWGCDDGSEYISARDVRDALATYQERDTELMLEVTDMSIAFVAFNRTPAA